MASACRFSEWQHARPMFVNALTGQYTTSWRSPSEPTGLPSETHRRTEMQIVKERIGVIAKRMSRKSVKERAAASSA